jgi:thioredoxin-like negative regulator of GroEL
MAAVAMAACLLQAQSAWSQPAAPLPHWSAQEAVAQFEANTGAVVIHFTSDDRGCSFCVGSNPVLDALGARYAGRIRFVRVAWSPWGAVPAELMRFQFRAMPATVGMKYGKVIWSVYGYAGPATVKQIDQHVQAMLSEAGRP